MRGMGKLSLFAFAAALAACGGSSIDDEPVDGTSSELGTAVVASDVSRIVDAPDGKILVFLRNGTYASLDPATNVMTSKGVDTSLSNLPKTPKLYEPNLIGFDANYTYLYARQTDWFYGNRSIFRIGRAPGAALETIGSVGNGENAPDPLATLIVGGSVYFTTLPNTCSLGSSDSCWHMAVGRTNGTRSTPQLADGTYAGFSAMATWGADVYAASATAIYKIPGGDLTKPLEKVCAMPASFHVKISNSTILAGTAHPGFAVSSKGFLVPLQSSDYRSALGLVRWTTCAPASVTPFGAPAKGSVSTWGVTQIADIIVRGNTAYWLDRQLPASGDEYRDSYYTLKRTSL